jgi:polyisoprenoid-binding protein YceI
MMTLKFKWIFSFLLFATCLQARETTFIIDNSCSFIGFTVKHMGISRLLVRFSTFEGTIDLVSDDITKSQVAINIKANSLNSGEEQRDRMLMGDSFFATNKNPEITFISTRIESRGDEMLLYGDLTIRGISKEIEIEIPLEMIHVITDPDGKQRFGLAMENAFRINRRDFGMTSIDTLDNGRLVIDNILHTTIFIEAVK